MSYLVLCTFDLEDGSYQDYQNAYSDLEDISVKRIVVSDKGTDVVIPTTSVIGKFTGSSSGSVREGIRARIKKAFEARGFTSEIFVIAASGWSWGATTT